MEIKGAAVVNTLPPYGHVIAAEKWRNSMLLQGLKGERSTIIFYFRIIVVFHQVF